MSLAALAERRARHAGDLFRLEQPLAERLAAKARALDRGEHVKRAQRFKAGKPHLSERVHHQPAAAVVAAHHVPDVLEVVLKAPRERFLRRDLPLGGGAHDRVLMNLAHDRQQLLRPAGVAHAPAGHGEGL